jgi:hypothetical protein
MNRMDLVVRKFGSHEEAREADLRYYRSLTPAERIEILLALIASARKEGDASSERLERVYTIAQLPRR